MREEKIYSLIKEDIIPEKNEITLVVSDGERERSVVYSEIEEIDYYDNGSSLKVCAILDTAKA